MDGWVGDGEILAKEALTQASVERVFSSPDFSLKGWEPLVFGLLATEVDKSGEPRIPRVAWCGA